MKKNLKQARSDAGFTQADIAKKLGVTYQMVYQWEKGLASVARKHWNTLASLLHVTEAGLEEILVQTLLDSCIAAKDSRALLNAQTSRLYRSDLILSALTEFNAGGSVYPPNPRPAKEQPADFERERLDFERAVFERDKRIFELEKQVEELRRELECRRPAASLSSALSHNQSANAVERTKQVEEFSSEVNHE